MIDHETLIWELFSRDLPDGTNFDNETNIATGFELELPALVFRLSLDGQTLNGPGSWSGVLNVTVTGVGGEAWSLASTVYDLVHGWADLQTGVIENVGHVQTLSDRSAFNRSSVARAIGKGVVQYAASFAVTVRE